jgi:hypothetical protein
MWSPPQLLSLFSCCFSLNHTPLLGQFQDIVKRPWPTLSHFVAHTVCLFMQVSKAEDLHQNLLCLLSLHLGKCDPIDAADSVKTVVFLAPGTSRGTRCKFERLYPVKET